MIDKMDLRSTILITGGGGLLGSKLATTLSDKYKTFTTYNTHTIGLRNSCSFYLDITNKKEVQKLIRELSPDVIIHTAALTDVDYCETNKKDAWSVNVEGTGNIAEASKRADSKFVYISTDYVFNGREGLYKEDDQPNPINYYGKTKLEGEKLVQKLDDHIIARTSVLYGWHSKLNFVTWIIQELKQEHRIDIVKDQFNSPTLADDLVDMILKLIETEKEGIFHVSGSERISRYDFAKKIAGIFELDANLINPITSDELNWIAKRPLDSSLDVSKISIIKRPLNIEEGLKKMKVRK